MPPVNKPDESDDFLIPTALFRATILTRITSFKKI